MMSSIEIRAQVRLRFELTLPPTIAKHHPEERDVATFPGNYNGATVTVAFFPQSMGAAVSWNGNPAQWFNAPSLKAAVEVAKQVDLAPDEAECMEILAAHGWVDGDSPRIDRPAQ